MTNGPSKKASFPFFRKGQRVAIFIACLILILATFIPWGFTKRPTFLGGWFSTTLLYFWIVLAMEVTFAIILEFSWLKKRMKMKNQ